MSNCGCSPESDNYMFFQNLKTIHHAVGELLKMDTMQIDSLLNDGHSWAVDHIASSADDVEEVYHFITGQDGHDDVTTHDYNNQQPQFIPADFKNHLKKLMPERIEKTKAGYFATTKSGRRLSQQAKTKRAALSQLAAVEIAKHKK